MTQDQLLQIIREWICDQTRSTDETICGLENVRDLCDNWLPSLKAEEG